MNEQPKPARTVLTVPPPSKDPIEEILEIVQTHSGTGRGLKARRAHARVQKLVRRLNPIQRQVLEGILQK